MSEIPYMMVNTRAEFERVRDLAWPATDRPHLADVTDARFTDDQRATLARFEAAPTPPEVCRTCRGRTRETLGMVCQTCGTDYAAETPPEVRDGIRTGPGGCHAALIIRGEHFWCDSKAPHTGWPHGSTAAETVWRGAGPAEDPAASLAPQAER